MTERRVVKIRSERVWALVREAFLKGEPAKSVARRFDVGEGNLRRRARVEGWSRKDAAAFDSVPASLTAAPVVAPEPEERPVSAEAAIRRALKRSAWLVFEGRPAEAEALMKAAERLCDLTGIGDLFHGRMKQSAP